jgi:Restriction Enzyme Adenine Methylase Associated
MSVEPDSVQLVTFAVPGSSATPMAVQVAHSGLRMVLVSRESISLLDESWKRLGVYFLLGAADNPDRYCAYVGEVGKSTLVQRIKQHADKKDEKKNWWSRALLIKSASDEFDSAEIGWLEGRLYDVLNNAVACELMNGNRPGDSSPSAEMKQILERYVEPIMASLRALGASPDTVDQKPERKGRKKPKRYSESVSDLLAAGLLKPETVLQPLRQNVTQTARVLADGRLEVGGKAYDSLSAAAKAVTGTVAEAGWDFWGAPSGTGGFVPLGQLRDRLRDGGADTTEPKPSRGTKPGVAKVPALAEAATKHPELFPLTIFADYRGTRIDAVVEPGGAITLGDESFTSPSMAAVAARKHYGYTGAGQAATNGWTFWRFSAADGSIKQLNELRDLAS